MHRLGLLIGAIAAPSVVLAQEGDMRATPAATGIADDTQIISYDETEAAITVTANGLRTDIANTGQAITLIGRDEIEAVQGADITRVLRRVPSATLSRSGPVGGFTSLSLRGASGEQVLVLVDGVRVADQASPAGGFDFGNLLTGTVGKLDILRGSNSTVWGSDAIGGVIEVSTRREAGLQASIEYGARDTVFGSLAAGLEGQRHYASLTGSYYQTDGFSAAASGTEADGFEQGSLAGSAYYELTDTLEAFVHGRYAEGDLDIDGFPGPTFQLADTLETQETQQYSGAIGLAYYGVDLTMRATYSLADTSRDNFSVDGAAPTFASDGQSERVSLRGEYRLVGGLSLAFGGEREWTDYQTTFSTPAQTSITGAYGQLGWVLGDLAVHGGARIDDSERFGSETSFGGDISYGVAQGWRLKASVGEGFKAPTLFQLFSNIGNVDLQPERSVSYDLGIERGVRGGPLHLALTAFQRDSDNLIDFGFDAANPNGAYFNVGQARSRGVELELGVRPSDRLAVGAVYAFIDSENRTLDATNFGNGLPRRPRHAATVTADWQTPLPALRLGGDIRLVGDSFDDPANHRPIDGYALVDLRATLDLADDLELFGRIENLFDADYQTVLGYGQAGRGAFVGIRAGL